MSKPYLNGNKILITTKRFPPEAPATAVLGKELAEALGQQGYQVDVAAGYPHHPYGRIFPGYKKKWLSLEEAEGYRLFRGWHFIHSSPAMLIRSLMMISQCGSYLPIALLTEKPAVVISFDGYPLIGQLTSTIVARMYKAKAVNVIYDIYPDIAVELGKLNNAFLIGIARKIENLIYSWSDKIVVLSEGFRRTLVEEKGVDPKKVAVIPVWLDAKDIFPLPRDNPWRREMGIPLEKFVILYAGTIGLVSGAEMIVEVAQSLAPYQDIQFLLVGDGYGKELVRSRVQEKGLKNIRFLPFQPRDRLSELQATADVSLVTLAPGRGRTSVPSKVLGYMAAARSVIASVDQDCDTADMIREAKCGIVIPPGNPGAMVDAVLSYYDNPAKTRLCGERGRTYFLKNFEKTVVIKKYYKLLQELI
ncbi:MAG: glycosyltransferase family 4 protein [Thermodesulfobacteriota bacterium]